MRRYIITVFFCLAIALPFMGDIFNIGSRSSLYENRASQANDATTTQGAIKYIKQFDNNFWSRDALVKLYIEFKKEIVGVSPLPEKLLIGKQGWLYLVDYGTMDDYRSVKPFSTTQVDSIVNYLTTVNNDLAKRKIAFYVSVVPDKHTIYPEYLPDNVFKVNPMSRLQVLTNAMKKTKLNFYNLTDTLLRVKRNSLLYLVQESHWNDMGTYVGYSYIIKNMQRQFPSLQVLPLSACTVFNGYEEDLDLAKLLGKDISYSEKSLKIVPLYTENVAEVSSDYTIPPAKKHNLRYAFKKVRKDLRTPSILVYRDSFFSSLVPYFEQTFSESTYIWKNDIDWDYIDKTKPDIVLIEIAERHIDLLMK